MAFWGWNLDTTSWVNYKTHIERQREALLAKNYDKLYGVYEVLRDDDEMLEFQFLSKYLVTFENQMPNLAWLEDAKDIVILDLKALAQRYC